jgi:hypothetical protein
MHIKRRLPHLYLFPLVLLKFLIITREAAK